MRILGWNCWGICNASIVKAFKAQIKGARPDLLFLSETKAKEFRMDFVKRVLKFDYKIVVEAKGKAGGLCIMWKAGIFASLVEFEKNLIAVKISDAMSKWLFVGFYGPPYYSKKKRAWVNLTGLLETYQGPWVCMGYFNFTVNEEEKKGGRKGSSSAPNYLKELMFEFGAIDLGYSGSKFT